MFTLQINENIILRRPHVDDAPAVFNLFESNRTHLTEWQDSPNKIQTIDDARAFIQRHNQAYETGTGLACLIIYNGEPVGMVYLDKIVSVVRKAEIGYWIAKAYEGQGIVTQST
ncbi:MAG: GNAT family N-acetyltransferase [Chloroflexota bacterium]